MTLLLTRPTLGAAPPPPPPPPPPTGAKELLARALAEHRLANYFKNWTKANSKLAPLVIAYLDGTGPRPTDVQLDGNHYGWGLVLTEDARRML